MNLKVHAEHYLKLGWCVIPLKTGEKTPLIKGWKPYQLKEPKIIVITDVRFQNEADYIFGKGGFVVEIKRKTDLKDGHISEDRTVTSNASIENNLGLAELYQEIKRVIFPIIPKVHFIKKHPGYLSVPESQLVEFYSTGRQFQEIPDLMDIKEYIVDIEIKDN